ncbi:MAG: tetratricopeptide repeat protein [Nitrospiraceae bacterium]|nr:tetratricopeptide repeat protein [Nitrospiraceae bacterium]
MSTLDYLFSSTTNSQDQLDSLANSALSRGIDRYTKKDYAGAAKEFQRSVGLSPSSSNSAAAYDYLAKAYQQLGKTDAAIKTYKTAIKVLPTTDSLHLSLGDIYFKNGQLKDAQAEYEKAVRLNPTSADNRYSLGQAYLTSGRVKEATTQFTKVTQLAPASPTGFYGLGQASRKSGDFGNAIVQLNKAVTMNAKFANAFQELGETYADMGNAAMAQKQLVTLQGLKATQQITTLQNYMAQAANPRLTMAYSTNGFNTSDGPKTAISALDTSLSSPMATKDFTMNFVFSKDMDKNSVENLANWQIGRQSGTYISNIYNFGMSVPATEVTLPLQPKSVVYNSDTRTASVTFTISQNAAGNGTIDPSHVSFKFLGEDTYGKTMDPKADEFSGFSTIV